MASKKPSLRDAAMAATVTGLKRLTWLEKLDDATRKEFTDFIFEWADGGELADRYPSRRSLCRFLSSQSFLKNIRRTSLDDTIADLIARRANG